MQYTGLPSLLHGSENWIIKARDTTITAAEMNYMRKTAGYPWTDYKTETYTAKELNITLSSGQNTGIQQNLVGTYKHNAS